MSILAYDVIDKLPYELAALLDADSVLVNVPVLVYEDGNIPRMVAALQGLFGPKNGKSGACILIPQIVAEDDFSELPFGPLTLKPAVHVLEQVEMNRGKNGTGLSARKIARRCRDVLKCASLDGLVEGITMETNCIVPLPLVKEVREKNVVGYELNLVCFERDTDVIVEQAAAPVFSQNGGGQLVLTTATGTATVYFTTDDSQPSPLNKSATVYAGPINVPANGFTVRAVAYAPGFIASGISRAIVT